MHDPVSEILTVLRNASKAGIGEVCVGHSKLKEAIARVLLKEGYLKSVNCLDGKIKKLSIQLKFNGKSSAISSIDQVSTPGLRRYVGASEIPRVLGGMGTAVVSTSSGVMSGDEARKIGHGGELLCFVW